MVVLVQEQQVIFLLWVEVEVEEQVQLEQVDQQELGEQEEQDQQIVFQEVH
jgi:hypothetical protein